MPEWLDIVLGIALWFVCSVGVALFIGRLIAAGKEGPDA